MSEIPRGDDNEEQFLAKQAEVAEFGRLSDEVLLLRSQIETGEHTDRTHLDKFLTTQVAYRQYRLHHSGLYYRANQRERDGEQFLKYQKVLRGIYQREKSEYCLEEALVAKSIADDYEKTLHEEGENMNKEEREESDKITKQRRMSAANWLRTAANCLTAPEDRPPASAQPEQTP